MLTVERPLGRLMASFAELAAAFDRQLDEVWEPFLTDELDELDAPISAVA